MDNKCMLTTFDNPFDPFEQFTSWFLFDVEKGYNTCGRLARIAKLGLTTLSLLSTTSLKSLTGRISLTRVFWAN